MLRKIAISTLLALALSSCSYGYDLIAVVRSGRLMFIVNPVSPEQPSCVRRVEVAEEDGQRDPLWLESVSYDDDCVNRFPLAYGARLKGQHEQDYSQIVAEPLRRGVVYSLSTTTGATGYGRGRFVIHADGRLENLKYPTATAQGSKATRS